MLFVNLSTGVFCLWKKVVSRMLRWRPHFCCLWMCNYAVQGKLKLFCLFRSLWYVLCNYIVPKEGLNFVTYLDRWESLWISLCNLCSPNWRSLTLGFVFRVNMDIHILDLVDNYDYDSDEYFGLLYSNFYLPEKIFM